MNMINQIRERATDIVKFDGMNTFINPYSYYSLRRTPDIISCFDRIYFDGSLAVVVFSFLFKRKLVRRSFDFTSVANDFFKFANERSLRIAVIGSTEESITKFTDFLRSEYKNIQIIYYRNGYFSDSERIDVINKLVGMDFDFLLVGMGTPYQEQFLGVYKEMGGAASAFTCGGFIHQTASVENGVYYPNFFNTYNLRWLYRIIDEPKLAKRYFIQYPLSIFYIMYDYIKTLKK